MRFVAALVLFAATSAAAQDSAFTRLKLRASALRLPVVGHIADDWRPKTGAQVELASNVGRGEIALAVGRVAFDALNGKPPFRETLISLGWTGVVLQRGRFGVHAGARLTDVRMHFDDPAMVAGLRNEEEQLISALARGRLAIGGKFSAFAETSYGMLMTSTRSPTVSVAIGIERDGAMPGWLRDILR